MRRGSPVPFFLSANLPLGGGASDEEDEESGEEELAELEASLLLLLLLLLSEDAERLGEDGLDGDEGLDGDDTEELLLSTGITFFAAMVVGTFP